MPLTTLTIAATSYASDEDLAAASPIDFSRLAPDANKLAAGLDGSIAGSEPRTLRSPTVDFSARGITPGRVVILKPVSQSAAINPVKDEYGVEGEHAIVATVIPGTAPTGGVTLRRPGELAGAGHPYAPATGLSPIRFLIATFDRQLALATAKVRGSLKALASDALLAGTIDDADLVELCVLRTFMDRYRDKAVATSSSGTGPDEYGGKLNTYKEEYKDKLAEITNRLTGTGTVIDPITGLPVTRGVLTGGLIRITTTRGAEWE